MDQQKKRIVYIAHPISGNVKGNLERIRRIVRVINMSTPYVIPFAPYWLDCHALDDDKAEERARGIENDLEYFKRGVMDELWVFGYTKIGEHSRGVLAEIEMANSKGIPVVYAEGSVTELLKQFEPDTDPYEGSEEEYLKPMSFVERMWYMGERLAGAAYDFLRQHIPGEKKFSDLDKSVKSLIVREEMPRVSIAVYEQCTAFEVGYAEGFNDGMGDKPRSMNPYDDGWNLDARQAKYGLLPVKFKDPTTMNL